MKAIVLSGVTPVEDVRLSEAPIPAVRSGWVLVRMRGRALNHSELVLRREEIAEPYIKKPVIPGIEGVGEVVDPSDQPFEAGQRVCALTGFYSNYPTQQVMTEIYDFVAGHGIRPLVARGFDFGHIADAIALQEHGGFQGQIVVTG